MNLITLPVKRITRSGLIGARLLEGLRALHSTVGSPRALERRRRLGGWGFSSGFTTVAQQSSSASKRMQNTRMRKSVISVTENAAKRIRELIDGKGDESISGIRLGVRSRGCSGKTYTMNYAKEPNRGDEVVQEHGVTIYVDPKAIMFVVGTTVDFVEDNIRSEFIFVNPNAKGSCGCGESFNT